MTFRILQGDNRQVLKTIADNTIDAIVTDPPYGIDFLGKDWDANTGALETYQECLRVLKPGGYMLAFSAARTYHHLAVTVETAGFEIRDQIMWIYGSGFPKSQDIGRQIDKSAGKGQMIKTGKTKVSGGPRDDITGAFPRSDELIHIPETDAAKQWSGWGTCLKPAHEPIVLARKPIKLSIAKNAQQWGTGALNIDATRIPTEDVMISSQKSDFVYENFSPENRINKDGTRDGSNNEPWQQHNQGRFPSNVLGDIPDYQKYFYCPKVSRRERHIGFDEIPYNGNSEVGGMYGANQAITRNNVEDKGNNHPTVKPIELMKYLIKLITPPGGVVLDPFNGSGSTGCAAVELGHDYIGCELDPAYVEITNKRILAWTKEENIFSDLFKE